MQLPDLGNYLDRPLIFMGIQVNVLILTVLSVLKITLGSQFLEGLDVWHYGFWKTPRQ